MDVNNINPFVESFMSVMPQLGFSDVHKGNLSAKDDKLTNTGVVMLVGIVGGIKGNVAYALDIESAKKIVSKMMMGMPVEELDEMGKSALSELSNMLTASAVTIFSQRDIVVDISPPTLLEGENVSLKIGSGKVLCIQLFADDIPIDINISFDN